MRQTIIVLGANSALSLGLIRCLGEGFASSGTDARLICVLWGFPDGHRGVNARLSRWPDVILPVDTPEEGVQYILDNLRSSDGKPLLWGANDISAAAIDARLKELEPHFLCPSANGPGGIVRWMDKRRQNDLAVRFGFQVPQMIVLHRGEPVPDGLTYPVFTKSCRSIDGGKGDEFICRNREELEKSLGRISAESFFVSAFIRKQKEIVYFGMVFPKEVVIPYKAVCSRHNVGGYGEATRFLAVDGSDSHVGSIKEMIRATNYRDGLFGVEFLEDQSGELHFMEVNFRHDGFTYLLTPGVNLPAQLCLSLWKQQLVSLPVGKKDFFGMNEWADFKNVVIRNHESLWSWLHDFMRADSRMVTNFRDPRPFLYFLRTKCRTGLGLVKNKIFRRRT